MHISAHGSAGHKPRLLTFNPETDYALASGLAHYTPPAIVSRLRSRLALLPAVYALPGDQILLPPELKAESEVRTLPYYDLAVKKRLKLVRQIDGNIVFGDIIPWGWDTAIKSRLASAGVDAGALPDDGTLEVRRELSHRRLTIDFNRKLNKSLGIDAPLPVEISNEEEAMEYIKTHPGCYLKSPWSSSGRGILIGGSLNDRLTREWIHGAIRRQKSIMAEEACARKIDFATEWISDSSGIHFAGLSLFGTTQGGSYYGNIILPQEELEERIESVTGNVLGSLKEAQQTALAEIIGKRYRGSIGIDCCADGDGDVRGCLEINLRITMGSVALHIDSELVALKISEKNQRFFNPKTGKVGDCSIAELYDL